MSLAETRPVASADLPSGLPSDAGPFWLAAGLTLVLAGGLAASFAAGVVEWTPAAFVALSMAIVAGVWISGGAATALLGALLIAPPRPVVPATWRPASRTAILVTLCKEDPAALSRALPALRRGLGAAGLGAATEIFVLSDTSGPSAIAREEAALVPLDRAGLIRYRRRARNTGRKPGNIADWLDRHGAAFDHMLVLDADSRMTADRIRRMIWQMDRSPQLGLLQAGIAIRPGKTRFGRHQRVAARMLARGFGRGFAAWSGPSGNYWGHNALIRVAAFRNASRLPTLPGAAPFGGAILSHDFVEAAHIRRAGWEVRLDPDAAGSSEEAPQTMAEFQARDRRWCQGNLQHLRLLAEPGFDPVSRLHLGLGVLGYIVAPVWLALLALVAFGGVTISAWLPLVAVAAVLMIPKVCALAERWRSARTARRRGIIAKASLGELLVSSLIAPLMMMRQAGSVVDVCLGRDCGWKTARPVMTGLRPGLPEAGLGAGLLALGGATGGVVAVLWLLPVALPLLAAPALLRAMDAPV